MSNKLSGGELVDVYRSAGVETTDAGYVKNPYTVNEAKGVGPLIMASCYANSAAEKYNDALKKYTVTFIVLMVHGTMIQRMRKRWP